MADKALNHLHCKALLYISVFATLLRWVAANIAVLKPWIMPLIVSAKISDVGSGSIALEDWASFHIR